MIVLPFLASVAGFLLFAVATDRHYRRRFGRALMPGKAALLRTGAWICLGLGIIPAILIWGDVFGPIAWVGTVISGAALVFFAMNLL